MDKACENFPYQAYHLTKKRLHAEPQPPQQPRRELIS